MAKSQDFVVMDKPQHSYIQALYQSFFSKSLYIDVVKRWQGFAFIYLMFLIGVICIPLSIYTATSSWQGLENSLLKPLAKLPTITISQGKVYFPHPMPYYIMNEETGKPAIVVDTTGKNNKLNERQYKDVAVLVTKENIYVRGFNKEIQKQPLSAFSMAQQFNGKQILGSYNIQTLKRLFQFSVYPILVSFLFGVILVTLMLFALIGQIISKTVMHFDMNYKQAVRLTFVASTPYMLFAFIGIILGFTSIAICLLEFFVLLGYFFFGLMANRKYAKQLVHA